MNFFSKFRALCVSFRKSRLSIGTYLDCNSFFSYKNAKIYLHTYFCAYINTHAIFCLFSSNKKWIYVLHFQLAKKLADHRALEIGEIVKYNELLYKYERRNKMASFGTSSKQIKACR